jgi:PAS domain S-box-containing protein
MFSRITVFAIMVISLIIGLYIVIQDSIEKKELQKLLQAMIDSMPSILIGVDKDLRITLWNNDAEKYMGVLAKQALGHKLVGTVPLFREYLKSIVESIKTNKIYEKNKVKIDIKNNTQYLDIVVYPLKGEIKDGAVIRIDNITDKLQIEDFLIQSEKILTIGKMTAGISHEINNYLESIIGTSKLLKNRLVQSLERNIQAADGAGVDFDKLQDFLNKRDIPNMLDEVIDSGFRVAEINKNMLGFVRKSDSQMQEYDLIEILDQSIFIAEREYNINKKINFDNINIVYEYRNHPEKIYCEKIQIQQVVINLLKNATQAFNKINDKKFKPVIEIKLVPDDDLIIKIIDNGPGIPHEMGDNIFKPFYTTKGVGQGTGLGLYICRHIVEQRHQGTLTYESEPGKGTTFIIRIPRVISNL